MLLDVPNIMLLIKEYMQYIYMSSCNHFLKMYFLIKNFKNPS